LKNQLRAAELAARFFVSTRPFIVHIWRVGKVISERNRQIKRAEFLEPFLTYSPFRSEGLPCSRGNCCRPSDGAKPGKTNATEAFMAAKGADGPKFIEQAFNH
jgi:hypothetical protein